MPPSPDVFHLSFERSNTNSTHRKCYPLPTLEDPADFFIRPSYKQAGKKRDYFGSVGRNLDDCFPSASTKRENFTYGPSGGTLAEQRHYDAHGRLVRTTRPGLADEITAYDNRPTNGRDAYEHGVFARRVETRRMSVSINFGQLHRRGLDLDDLAPVHVLKGDWREVAICNGTE